MLAAGYLNNVRESVGIEIFTVCVLGLIVLGSLAYLLVRSHRRRQLAEYHEQLRNGHSSDPFKSMFGDPTDPAATGQDNDPAQSAWTLDQETKATEMKAIGRLGRIPLRGASSGGLVNGGPLRRQTRPDPLDD